ncbi:MAG: HAD-IC family P-type ATPase [Micrococcales bacterium]
MKKLPKLLAEIPYDFARKRLSVLVQLEKPTLITKGAYSGIADICSQARINSKLVSMTKARAELDAIYASESNLGNRVLAIATKQTDEAKEVSMVFEGFLVFADELKPDAAAEVARLQAQGIEFYLITGDNSLAAKYIASQVGIPAENVVTGKDISSAGNSKLTAMVKSARVFAEVDPLQKARIVKTLSAAGNTVGFFGDGINDSAAIKAADVGISVDTAVDIAKESAAIVLLDHNLDVIAKGVRLGRTTFVNTMKYVRVTISANFGNVFSMAIASIFLPFLPLLPLQILLLNFLSDMPALTIATDRVDESELEKPHAWDIKQIRKAMISFGLISSIFDVATFVILTQIFKADQELFRTTWFIESCLTELIAMLVLRTKLPFYRSRASKPLSISSAVIAVLLFAIPFLPFASSLVFVAISWQMTFVIFSLAAGYLLLNEMVKRRV